MTDLNFIENAEAIFEKSISATPFPFRKTMKNGLIKLLVDHFGDEEISEAMLINTIKENTPGPFIGKGMAAIRPLITDPELVDNV